MEFLTHPFFEKLIHVNHAIELILLSFNLFLNSACGIIKMLLKLISPPEFCRIFRLGLEQKENGFLCKMNK